MTRFEAQTTPMIELAEMLVENVEEFEGRNPVEIADSWDRYDLIEALTDADVFEFEN